MDSWTRAAGRSIWTAALLGAAALAGAPGAAAQQSEGRALADTLSLSEAVDLALARSPAIRTAEAQRTVGRAGRWASWGQLIPSVYLSTGLNQAEDLRRTATDPITGGIISLPDSLIQTRQTYGTQAALSLEWTVFDGGRRIWGIRQAEAEVRAADLALRAARARIAGSLTVAYLDALEASALAQTRRAELERASELVRLAQARYDVGEAPQMDVLQAQVAAGDAEIALLEAESAAEAARLALAEYLPSLDLGQVALADPPMPDAEALSAQNELGVCAVEESPELAALRAEVSAARRGVEMQRLWLLPTVTVGTTWVRSEFGQTREALTFEPRNEQTYYRVGLSWTPFDQPGRQMAERHRAHATLQLAEAELQSRRAAVLRNVKIAADRLSRAKQQEERRRLNLKLAELQREQAIERYRLGAGSIVERFQAEALAREAERQAIAARYAALRAVAELQSAAGIGLVVDGDGWRCEG